MPVLSSYVVSCILIKAFPLLVKIDQVSENYFSVCMYVWQNCKDPINNLFHASEFATMS